MTECIAIDFETYLIDKDNPYPKPVCLSIHTERNENDSKGLDSSNSKRYSEVLVGHEKMHQGLLWAFNSGKKIVAHNITFEAGVIWYHFSELRQNLRNALAKGNLACTMIQEQLMSCYIKENGLKSSLSALVDKYLEVDISHTKGEDSWRTNYNQLDGIPIERWPQAAIDYSLGDSIYAHKIFQIQESRMQGEATEAIEASIWLNLMASLGITIDCSRVRELRMEIGAKLKPHYDLLIDMELCRYSKGKIVKNMKVFRGHLRKTLGKNVRYTPKRNVSTSGEDLAYYQTISNDPVVNSFVTIATYEKVISAFTNRLEQADPVIRTNYSVAKSSGRTSSTSSKLYPSVNIQQMPRQVPDVNWDVRNCFVPREGFKICSIDYTGLEMASVAHQLYKLFGKSAMKDAMNEGEDYIDMHSKLACQIMRNSLPNNSPIGQSIDPYEHFIENKKKKQYKHYRQLSKPINLGFPGGLGYDTTKTLLFKEGIITKYEVLERFKYEQEARWAFRGVKDIPNLRIERTEFKEWSIVYDELVGLKQELFRLYPELGFFLSDGHKQFMTGETSWRKNDYGEWEEEPMYSYDIYGHKRDWCTYTAFCNGYLMQTPAAIGAKRAMCDIISSYIEHPDVNPLAFIHDEILFEVRDNDEKELHIENIAYKLVRNMKTVLDSVHISVEAELMSYWSKDKSYWSRVYGSKDKNYT